MRNIAFALAILLSSVSFADEVTEYSVRFGNGYLTRRTDGSIMTTQRFGNGTLQRESFRSGKSARHVSTPFGRGVIKRSVGAYVRKP